MVASAIILPSLFVTIGWFHTGDAWLFERKRPLAIPGSWAEWGSWSLCYLNSPRHKEYYPEWEDFMVQSRNRTCSDPEPLFGGADCEGSKFRYRQCSCTNPLGMGNRRILNTQITASSEDPLYPASEGRAGTNSSGWCSGGELDDIEETYLEITFDYFSHISAIVTEGITIGRVQRYELQSSLDGKNWNQIYVDVGKTAVLFSGNIFPKSAVRNDLSSYTLAKHLRIKPASKFGQVCLKTELYGCTFSCGTFMSNSTGVIVGRSSPNTDQNCLWKVEVKDTTSLTFDFQSFFVMCRYGYLDFHDGRYPFSEAPLLKHFCVESDADDVSVYKHFGNSVWLNFVSNASSPDVSFHLSYFSSCKQNVQLEVGKPVTISSPNYPENYFHNSDCQWTIETPGAATKIQLGFNLRDLEIESSSDGQCSSDYLSLETVYHGISTKIGKYCDAVVPPKEMSLDADVLIVNFRSDSAISGRGFSFSLLAHGSSLSSAKPATSASDVFPGPGLSTETIQGVNTGSVTEKVNGSLSYSDFKRKVPKTNDSDDTWTVVTISAFAAVVVVLLVAVAAMNIRRCVASRNEVNAQCAKIAAEEKRQKKKKLEAANKNFQREQLELLKKHTCTSNGVLPYQTVITPSNTLPGASNHKNNEDLSADSSIDQNHSETLSTLTDNDVSNEGSHLLAGGVLTSGSGSSQSVSAEIDGSGSCDEKDSYDSSSPQIHSPLIEDYEDGESPDSEDINIVVPVETDLPDSAEDVCIEGLGLLEDADESIV